MPSRPRGLFVAIRCMTSWSAVRGYTRPLRASIVAVNRRLLLLPSKVRDQSVMSWYGETVLDGCCKTQLQFRSAFALMSLIASALVLAGCSSSAEQKGRQAPPAPLVETIVAHPGSADIYSEFPAQTYARNQVEVRGRVDGYIEQWLFRPGQQVTAGQALYRLRLATVSRSATTGTGKSRTSTR